MATVPLVDLKETEQTEQLQAISPEVQKIHDQAIFPTSEATNDLSFGTKIYSLHILMLLTVFCKKDLNPQ